MSEIPKFRRLEDVQRYLEEVSKNIDISQQLVVQQQKLLSKLKAPTEALRKVLATSFVEFDVSPGAGAPRRGKTSLDKSAIAPSINKVVIPNLSKLKDQYGLMEELHAQRITLNSVETQMAMQFSDKRRGALFNATLGTLNEMRAKVDAQLLKVLEFLSDVAHKHVPKVFSEYVEAIVDGVESHVSFESAARFLYVSVNDGALHFTEYLMLTNSANDDGQVAPHLYIVIQWRVGRAVEVFVEHEFSPPHQLSDGQDAKTVRDAMDAITHLLQLEGFTAAIGRAPLGLNMKVNPNKLTPSMFQAKDMIKEIRIATDGNELEFLFRNKPSADERKKLGYLIFQDMKQLMLKKKTKIRMQVKPNMVSIFILDIAEGYDISTTDLQFLRERFGLSEQAVSKISRIVNQDKQ